MSAEKYTDWERPDSFKNLEPSCLMQQLWFYGISFFNPIFKKNIDPMIILFRLNHKFLSGVHTTLILPN